MINIFYNGNTVPADNDGTPTNLPAYWTPEILAGIAQAFADGHWEPVSDPGPPAPEPDWAGLRADLLDSATVSAWFDTLRSINREDITAQIQGRDVLSLNDALSRVNYDSVKVELNKFLTNRNIGVELP